MDIFKTKEKTQKIEIEPIRGSIVILVFKVVFIMLTFDLIFNILYYIFNIQFNIPYEFYHHFSLIALIILFAKSFVLAYFMIIAILSWANNTYFLTEKHLVQREGLLNIRENIYDFNNIRSISVNQNLIGKIFHYGDIILKTSASGGYQGDISLVGISNPEKYEKILKECF